jgi:NDP-sugar pyrophosphorylase family protein
MDYRKMIAFHSRKLSCAAIRMDRRLKEFGVIEIDPIGITGFQEKPEEP